MKSQQKKKCYLTGSPTNPHQLKRAVSVVQFLLRFNKEYRSLPSSEQRMNALKKFIRGDYQTLRKQLALRANKISQGLKIEEDKRDEMFFVTGRYNYTAILLARPQTSSFARLVLRDSHNANHLTSSNRILVKVSRSYLFTGGALTYLNKLRNTCTTCNVPRKLRALN